MTLPEKQVEAEERRQLRPYRRLVGLVFALAVAIACVLVARGIIRHLDRMPSVEELYTPSEVDVRALRACSEDLERLEVRVRAAAGRAFSGPPFEGQKPAEWQSLVEDLELERLRIVARCRLNQPSGDPVEHDLEQAANEIEGLLRSYGLLYARHIEDGLPHSVELDRALKRANDALRTR